MTKDTSKNCGVKISIGQHQQCGSGYDPALVHFLESLMGIIDRDRMFATRNESLELMRQRTFIQTIGKIMGGEIVITVTFNGRD